MLTAEQQSYLQMFLRLNPIIMHYWLYGNTVWCKNGIKLLLKYPFKYVCLVLGNA